MWPGTEKQGGSRRYGLVGFGKSSGYFPTGNPQPLVTPGLSECLCEGQREVLTTVGITGGSGEKGMDSA